MKNRERNMATPEETRDRIKEMRDRIFKDSDKDSTQNNIQETSQENKLAEKKLKVSQKNENPSDDTKPAEPKKASSSEKPQPFDDMISLVSADTKKQISEIVLEFTGKLNSLETEILEKLEHTFSESNSKIIGIESLVNNSNISSSQANESLKEELQKLNRSLQLDISSVSQRLTSANEKIKTELQNSSNKLTKLENSVEERQKALEESFYEKLQQSGDRLSLFCCNFS